MNLAKLKLTKSVFSNHHRFDEIVRCLVSGILLTAASLKVAQLYGDAALNDFVMNVREGLNIAFEVALALLIIAPFRRIASWWISLLCFMVFAVVSLTKAIHGHATCGCFGKAEISPWFAFTLDVLIVMLLGFTGHSLRASRDCSVSRTSGGHHFVFSFCIACFGWLVVSVVNTGRLRSDVQSFDPDEWVGRPLPLLADIDIGKSLASGEWDVVLFRHDCPDCQTLLSSKRRFRRLPPNQRHIAFISIPPHDRFVSDELQSAGMIVGEMSDRYDWAITTPMVVSLRSGIVVAISHEHRVEEVDSRAASSSVVYSDFREREANPPSETLRSQIASLSSADQDCGVQCLYVLSRVLGRARDFSWFKDRIPTVGTGASLLDLKQTAREAGLTVEAVRASLSDVREHWRETGCVAILHVNDAHYVAILGFTDNEVRLFDPSRGIREVKDTEFARRYTWSGVALLLRDPLVEASRI